MRVKTPDPFQAQFIGPEGQYTTSFQRYDEWDGFIEVTIAGVSMHWNVDNVEFDEGNRTALSGLTQGSEELWQDCYWFELVVSDRPVEIHYWGNGYIWRTDAALRT